MADKSRTKAFLSIDPGENIGVALWNCEQNVLEPPLLKTAIIPPSGWEWQRASTWSYMQFKAFLIRPRSEYNILTAVMEYPMFFEDASVVAKKGNLVKLACSAGMVMAAMADMGIPLLFVEVRAWKGQMSKEAVAERIQKRLPGIEWKSSHEMDAVGIGLHAKGFF